MLVGRSCGFSFIQRSRFVTKARQDRRGIVAARNMWVFIIRRSSLTSDYPQLQPGREKFSMPCPRKQNKTSHFSAVFFWWCRPKYVASYPLFVLSPILLINFVEMMRTRQWLAGTIFQLKYLTSDLGRNLWWHHPLSHSSSAFSAPKTLSCAHFSHFTSSPCFSWHILLHDRGGKSPSL